MPDGSLDESFGTGGIADGEDSKTAAIAISKNSNIFLGGTSAFNRFTIMSFKSNGSRDESFGSNGVVSTDIGKRDEILSDIAIQTDGKIVAKSVFFKMPSPENVLSNEPLVLILIITAVTVPPEL